MKRIIILVIAMGLLGLIIGYLFFARSGGGYIEISRILSPSKKLLDKVGDALIGMKKIRQNIMIAGGAGAGAGLIIGLATRIPAKKKKRRLSKKRR
ncbi:MAG TPA: hypothetical protein ENI15_00685 [Spirochaetes bacterium]|nr:hypothetical protein [Spirochaetota bacterium]